MQQDSFQAILAKQSEEGLDVGMCDLTLADLPPGNVLIRVQHSALNYKDALAVTGKGKIFRRLPMVPGVDLAGVVEASDVPEFDAGDEVVVTGTGIGEAQWGGYAGYARLDAERLIHVPEGWGSWEAMAVGTAGITAMLCIMALEEQGVFPRRGRVLVTGAGGGVGGFAVALLHGLGYDVTAVTGRAVLAPYLTELGATDVLPRSELDRDAKPLEKERWRGVVDVVGGKTLATAISQTFADGAVAACGLAGGSNLPTTVFPFILRNVTLCGVDSVACPRSRRAWAWSRVRELLSMEVLKLVATSTVPLADVQQEAERLLSGQVQGRTVVALT